MTLVAGVDSSTQSCKIVIRDAADGALVREARAAHPDGTEAIPISGGGLWGRRSTPPTAWTTWPR